MDIGKFIRFAFASRRRKLLTLTLLGASGIGAIVGGSNAASDSPIGTITSTTSSATTHVYYANCSEAPGPILRGQPGYRSPLDRNNDGVACE